MRQFIVLGHEVATTPDFTLNDLPGSAGRLDVLCRCVNSAFMLSHGLREEVQVQLVLQDKYSIRIDGNEVQYLNPDERSTAALLQKALEKATVKDVATEQRSTPGIYIREAGFQDALARVDGTIIQLHGDGVPVTDIPEPDNPVFVLSDHNDFTDAEQERLEETAAHQVSLGPEPLHADHAITVAHNYLDTDGFTLY